MNTLRGMATSTNLSKILQNIKGFDAVLNKVNILSAENGKCKAEMIVDKNHTNPMGGLHGGLSATLVDTISSFALATKEGKDVAHVSVDMHLTYLKGATVGDSILIDAKTVKSGRTLAFLEVLITNKNSGDILVKGSHTKFILRKG